MRKAFEPPLAPSSYPPLPCSLHPPPPPPSSPSVLLPPSLASISATDVHVKCQAIRKLKEDVAEMELRLGVALHAKRELKR
eukprot:756348-Hanusia_phi.AAC.4